MANDDLPPLPRIAVIGAGPIGIEAALYGRFLGYPVAVLEKGTIAANVRAWGHVRMFSPFSFNHTNLGLAALTAQDASYVPPRDDELLTGAEYAERYLYPLAQTDLVANCIHESATALMVGRDGPIKPDVKGIERDSCAFRILVDNADGEEEIVEADIVIDASGMYSTPNWLGHGGIPAIGERKLRPRIESQIPDVLGAERDRYAGAHTLVIGGGYSAATTVVGLGKLSATAPGTRVTWVTRRASTDQAGPIRRIEADRLSERDRLAAEANQLVTASSSAVEHFAATSITAIKHESESDSFRVQLSGAHEGEYEFDRIVANVGYRPDTSLYSELQVHQCYATDGPMKLAASLLDSDGVDCLDQASAGPQSLRNPEPSFYILGSKSYGRNSNFLLSVGFEQIRDVYTMIGEREDLDLYASIKPMASGPS